MLQYPPNNHKTDSKSIFFFGSANESCKINNEDVELYENGNFCHIVKLKLGENKISVEIDGEQEERIIEGIKASAPNPVAYGKHYESFPCEKPSKRNILRSILVSNEKITIPLNVPPVYHLEKHGSHKLVMDLADMDMDLDWIHYQDADSKIIIGEVIDSRFPIIFRHPIESFEEVWQDGNLILTFKYKDSSFKVCLDPGHGGDHNGTVSPKGIYEKDLNLKIASLIKEELTNLGINSVMTREDDSNVSLEDRVALANQENCNLVVSLHHNALPDSRDPRKERGLSCHYFHEQSKPFASHLLGKLVEFTGLPYAGLFKQNLYVLRETTDCAAILVELGFLIHPEESEIITGEEFQTRAARVIAKNIYNFYVKKSAETELKEPSQEQAQATE